MAMKIPIYQIDAFTDKLFAGNPATVVPIDQWLEDDLLQKIATENNQTETAFFLCKDGEYHIRWFTPVTEVDLCGHATLAAAFVLFNCMGLGSNEVVFNSRSGPLRVVQRNDVLFLDFPSDHLESISIPKELKKAFNISPVKALKGKTDYLLIYKKEDDIMNLQPDIKRISEIDCRGVIVSSPGTRADFVSRFFAPKAGISEDSVTGSTHTTLTPYWAIELRQEQLLAQQLSRRGGTLTCEFKGERIIIGGKATLYMAGYIYYDELI